MTVSAIASRAGARYLGGSTSSGSANRSRTAAVNATFRIVPTLILAIPARTARCRSSPETPEDPCAPQARAAVFAADFAELGFQEQPSVMGLAASTEAVDIRRELAAARPDAFRPGLAGSLNNQSTALAGLARREDALAASEEAVAICRELIAIVPVFRQSLARSLTSFGIRLTEKKDFDAALSADREAVAIYAALLSLDPQRYRDPLERVVRNLATHLRDLGRGEQEIADELDSLLSADDH